MSNDVAPMADTSGPGDRSRSRLRSAGSAPDGAAGAQQEGKAPIQSLVRANDILSAIAERGPGGARLSEIAMRTGLNKSTAHHLLRTLVGQGFVERAAGLATYRIGLRAFQLVWQSHRLRELSAQYHATMMRLCHRTGETVNLALPYGDATLVASSLEGRGIAPRASNYTGAVWALHGTACGKAILAYADETTQQRVLSAPLERFTPHTITTPDALADAIVRIRRDGVAHEVEEQELGAACVAAPLIGSDGVLLGAISIAGPLSRMDEARRQELATLLVREIASGAGPQDGGPPAAHRKQRTARMPKRRD